MVELTHGGTWLKWSSLNRRDRNWALLSFVTSGLSALPVSLLAGDWAYRFGFRVGSGGEPPPTALEPFLQSELFAMGMLVAAILAAVSAFAWWQFSRNQDEMFNRIQNYALGQAGAWTLAFAVLWWLLWLGRWVAPLSLTIVVLVGTALLLGFWFHAVRRWA